MGSCRTLNVLMGMSGGGLATPALGGFAPDQWLIAGGIGVYVMGITWFARSEARTSSRVTLGLGLLLMGLGVVLLAAFPSFSSRSLTLLKPSLWPWLLALLMFSVARRCVLAVINPSPTQVQHAVKHSILSLIVLDAAVVLATVGPVHALGILALLIPTVILGRWIYST